MQVIDYLQSGKTYADLETELGIKATHHDSLPLVILNYSQIDSPKTHPIVRECRGLVLRSDTHELVARAFPRFFNWGELADEMPLFDFSEFSTQTKEDGSLVLLYFFGGEWHANTRGSFGLDKMQFHTKTWRQAFADTIGIESLAEFRCLRTDVTLVCEFCSQWNKVIRAYQEPAMFMLTAYQEHELSPDECDRLAAECGMPRPVRHDFASIEEIQGFLRHKGESDPTFEGVVIRDRNDRRWKIKSATYLGLHRLKGDGDSLFHPKNLLPFVLSDEESELLTYFPEVEETFRGVKAEVESAYLELSALWHKTHAIESQKEFALAVVGHTPFSGILFQVRKKLGGRQSEADLRAMWRNSADAIVKNLFKQRSNPCDNRS